MAVSPNGVTFATGGEDGTVRVWAVATGAEVHTPRGDGQPVQTVAYAPDGSTLAAAGPGVVGVYDARTGEPTTG